MSHARNSIRFRDQCLMLSIFSAAPRDRNVPVLRDILAANRMILSDAHADAISTGSMNLNEFLEAYFHFTIKGLKQHVPITEFGPTEVHTMLTEYSVVYRVPVAAPRPTFFYGTSLGLPRFDFIKTLLPTLKDFEATGPSRFASPTAVLTVSTSNPFFPRSGHNVDLFGSKIENPTLFQAATAFRDTVFVFELQGQRNTLWIKPRSYMVRIELELKGSMRTVFAAYRAF